MLLDIINSRYTDDISIMIIYGSSVNGTAHDKSDLDMLVVPRSQHGWSFARTFILDEVGYDIWGVDWDRLEQFASFDDMKVSVLADSQLVYCSRNEDRQRYEAMKDMARRTANGPLTPNLLGKAERHLNIARQHYGELCLDVDFSLVGGILMEVCDTICLLNHTYLRFGGKQIANELSRLKRVPPGFVSLYTGIVERMEDPRRDCATLITITGNLIQELKAELLQPVLDLSGLYEELSSLWNKLRFSCANDETLSAFWTATVLQDDLNSVQRQLGLSIPELQFFDEFDPGSLGSLVLRADVAESAFLDLLQNHGVLIASYASLEELRQSFV